MGNSHKRILGIHHITAIAGNAQRAFEFYSEVLGLRMIKQTVNFDVPDSYHLYFGDDIGRPGTALTFFIWPGAGEGRTGMGQATSVSFSIPDGSIAYWLDRLKGRGIAIEGPYACFDEEVICLCDPDGLELELVSNAVDRRRGWTEGPVPDIYAIRAFYGITLTEGKFAPTARMIMDVMGFKCVRRAGNLFRFETGDGGPGTFLDLEYNPDVPHGHVALGTVHHVAWRTPDDQQHKAWRESMAQRGFHVTPIIDRLYFHSIYFREPGGVLFEIATDTPGFTVDETPAMLGTSLKLPPWMESERARIVEMLPPLNLNRVRERS